ncbi:MAG: hypothetical protein GTN78_13615 [Gemmatimonadales bacterium]|nr:hypothetical protein [Gemmatimonadales bacterium]NIR01215.1 hypothetical protein [Gemmatimonadales bacterium]NIS65238.1 hypothetical protein [Gemmatimonadales bacterium]
MKVIGAGVLGGIVLMVWTLLVDGILGFHASIDMRQVAEERVVYETLKQHIVDPGKYAVNPAVTPEGRYPAGEPVFSVLYGGVGHESAGGLMLIGLVVFFLAPLIGAWMLSQASGGVISSYSRKVLFFVAIGLLFALFSDVADFGIGGYPAGDAILLAVRRIVDWTLVGLVVAWRIRPEPSHAVIT